ncbi:MAG: HEAT repeat domain-containing protein [Planctomycetes bacterium]|nr:HEAT repeat domain-containing protein [Planctomycetota bacterium]
MIANHIAQSLGSELLYDKNLAMLREAIEYKNKFWNEYQRPKNWKCLFGDDSERIFSIGRGGPQITLRSEWDQLPEFITFAESRIQDILKGRKPAERRVVNEKLTGSDQASIKKELASFKLDSRYQVNAFATEADGIPCPLQMCWDTQGRLYVISSTAYPQVMPGEYANDKIIILEDTNHDGRADQSTVFADGLNIPTGIALGERGIYVANGTELLFLKDTDGDNKADVREVLFSGFGTQDTHQTSNSLTWSPDGMLLFGQGDGIESRVETAYGFSSVYQAGFYRFNPHNQKLDTILNDWGGPANPWGIVFDDWGQSFSCCGAGGIDYLTQGMLPNEKRRKIKEIGKPGGYCGMEMISSTLMPSDMQGDFIIGDYKRKAIPRFTTVPDGSGFKVKWKDDLLKTSHRNFMPVDIQMGPDGAIYIVDWYNPITCHQDDYFRDVARDKTHGRIWRISLKNEPARQPINLTKLSDAELVKQLGSLERWYRYYSRREMTTRNRDHIATEIEKWIEGFEGSGDRYEHHLYEAISALATIDCVNEKLLLQLLKAKDYRARAFAAERVGHWHDRLQNPLSLLAKAVGDKHPLVRMKAILGLAHIPDAHAVEVAAKVTDMPMDEGIKYAFAQAVNHLKPYWLSDMGKLFQGNAEHLAAVLSQVKSKNLREKLLELAKNKSLNPKTRLAVMRRLAVVGNKYDLYMIFNPKTYGSGKSYQADMHASLLTKLVSIFRAQGKKPQGDLAKTLEELIDKRHTGVKVAAMTLADLWGEKSLQPNTTTLQKLVITFNRVFQNDARIM